jgi:hypothetical protein
MLQERAAVERMSLAGATEDLQDATDRIARVAVAVVTVGRRFWLPVAAVAAAGLYRRVGPVLRLARTGLTIWQIAKMVRTARQ